MTDPPAEILRRLRPIPTHTGHPTSTPHDVAGVDPAGTTRTVEVVDSTAPVLLLFLSADCIGCRDLWEGLADLHAGLGVACRLAVVTKSPGDENPQHIAALAGAAPGRLGIPVVMSTEGFGDYRVAGAPFMVVADAAAVRAEGVAWGIEETLRAALASLGEQ